MFFVHQRCAKRVRASPLPVKKEGRQFSGPKFLEKNRTVGETNGAVIASK
jgi:hypothetical protein